MNNEFANINVYFQLPEKRKELLLHNFNQKVRNKQKWVSQLTDDFYVIRACKNRWFFFNLAKQEFYFLEQIMLWDYLVNEADKSVELVAQLFHVSVPFVEASLDYFYSNKENLQLSNLQF